MFMKEFGSLVIIWILGLVSCIIVAVQSGLIHVN